MSGSSLRFLVRTSLLSLALSYAIHKYYNLENRYYSPVDETVTVVSAFISNVLCSLCRSSHRNCAVYGSGRGLDTDGKPFKVYHPNMNAQPVAYFTKKV